MAYLDKRGVARSPAALIAVAALEAGLIYAVVSGLAARFMPPDPPERTTTTFVPLPPPPPSPAPSASPSDSFMQNHQTRPLIPLAHPSAAPSPAPSGEPRPYASPSPQPTSDPLPQPSPTPAFTPRGASPLGKPAAWVTNSDYPSRDLSDGNQGLVRFSLAIGADGRVTGCTITGSSGHPGLDKAACTLISRRARFEAATDSSGARTLGNYTGSVRWVIPN